MEKENENKFVHLSNLGNLEGVNVFFCYEFMETKILSEFFYILTKLFGIDPCIWESYLVTV